MINVAITGHSKGLGKVLFDKYVKQGQRVEGFSRSNQYDLQAPYVRTEVVRKIQTFDVIINNAPGIFQRDLFAEVLSTTFSGVIVNVSSLASRFGPSHSNLYTSDKAALDSLTYSHQHFGPRWPAALLVRPSYFTGERSANKPGPHVDVHHVADQIIDAVELAVSDVMRLNEFTIVA